jgi:hypothetical protein
MKNIKPFILFALLGILCFAQTASGQSTAQAGSERITNRLAVSPYAQAVPNDSYTFIGISHPSLSSASSAIGVVVEVIGMETTTNSQAGRSSIFTIDAGETHRVFVVNQGHSTINSSNTSFTDNNTHLIPTVDTSQFGSIRVTTVAQDANTAVNSARTNNLDTYENLAQLSMWGVVYVESGGAGFAMEFIGDMADSRIHGYIGNVTPGTRGFEGVTGGETDRGAPTQRPGAGIN